MKKSTRRVLWVGGLTAAAAAVGTGIYFATKPRAPSLGGGVALQMPPIANAASIPRGTTLTLLPPSGGKMTGLMVDAAVQPGPVVGPSTPAGTHQISAAWTDATGVPGVGAFSLQVT